MPLRKTQFLDWEIGAQLMVERHVDDKPQRGSSRLLGVYQQSYLIAELPFAYGMPMFSSVGASCIVRFLNAGTLLGFRSSVVKISHEPFPMMVLEYPRKMEEMTLRKHDRLGCNLPARIAFLDQEELKVLTETRTEQAAADPEEDSGNGNQGQADAAQDAEAADSGQDEAQSQPEDTANGKAAQQQQPSAPTKPCPARKLDLFYREANVVDLALGGCQMVILTHEGMDINRHKDLLERIPRSDRSEYSSRILKREASLKQKVLLDFDMPEGLGGTVQGSLCSLQWNREQDAYLALGLAFDEPQAERDKAIRFLMDFQSRYFSHHYAARSMRG